MKAWEEFGRQQERLRRKLREQAKETMEALRKQASDPRSGNLGTVFLAAVVGFLIGGPPMALAFAAGTAGIIHLEGGWYPQRQHMEIDPHMLQDMAQKDASAALDDAFSEHQPHADRLNRKQIVALVRRIARCRAYGLDAPSDSLLPLKDRAWLSELDPAELALVAKLPSRRLQMHLDDMLPIKALPSVGRARSALTTPPAQAHHMGAGIIPRPAEPQESGFHVPGARSA